MSNRSLYVNVILYFVLLTVTNTSIKNKCIIICHKLMSLLQLPILFYLVFRKTQINMRTNEL